MKTITFYGASDDLLEVEGDIAAEIDAYNSASVLLKSSNGTMCVYAEYSPQCLPGSVWVIGVAPEPAWGCSSRRVLGVGGDENTG